MRSVIDRNWIELLSASCSALAKIQKCFALTSLTFIFLLARFGY